MPLTWSSWRLSAGPRSQTIRRSTLRQALAEAHFVASKVVRRILAEGLA